MNAPSGEQFEITAAGQRAVEVKVTALVRLQPGEPFTAAWGISPC